MRGILIFFLALLLFGCGNTELPKEVAEAYDALPKRLITISMSKKYSQTNASLAMART